MIWDAYEQVILFLERGGLVLSGVLVVTFLLWLAIFERITYFLLGHRRALAHAVAEWESRSERQSWNAHQIRQDLIVMIESALERNMSTIKMLIGLCPLFGLLGTVTGMIAVFDVMSYMGSASPKAMAAGISKATIPTMAGMVAAITGVFGHSMLDRYIRREKSSLEDTMTFDH